MLLVLVAAQWMPQLSSSSVFFYAMLAAGVGMVGPNIVLRRLVESRQKRLRNGFPDALDMLVVCVEAGLGLTAAIQRVADELRFSHPELATELALVNAETRAGVEREAALKNLTERTGLDDVRGLVGLLVQTLRFGTSIADTLRVYSEEFRDKRMQKAEELAAKIGTKLIFPLVFCLFPSFFVVAIGPAVLRIIEVFSQLGSNVVSNLIEVLNELPEMVALRGLHAAGGGVRERSAKERGGAGRAVARSFRALCRAALDRSRHGVSGDVRCRTAPSAATSPGEKGGWSWRSICTFRSCSLRRTMRPRLRKLGALHEKLGNLPLARRAFELALAATPTPDVRDDWSGWACSTLQNGDDEQARVLLLRVTLLDEKRWRAFDALGVLADRRKEYFVALGNYEAALRLQTACRPAC